MTPAFVLLLVLASDSPAPEWINQPARTVDNGYIVYVTQGEATTLEQATFKSEAAGALDVANECSFAPKGMRVEDHFQAKEGSEVRVYTKTGLAFNDCEIAQAANDPAEIKRLANAHVEEMIKTYEASSAPPTAADPPPAAAPTPPQAAEQPQAAAPRAEEEEKEEEEEVQEAARPAPVFSSPEDYLVARQRIFLLKQTVILAPANAYPPGAPQTVQFVQNVTPLTLRVHTYQVSHPALRTWVHTWSSYRRHPRDAVFVRPRAEHMESHFPAGHERRHEHRHKRHR